jgi:hypothetical protein
MALLPVSLLLVLGTVLFGAHQFELPVPVVTEDQTGLTIMEPECLGSAAEVELSCTIRNDSMKEVAAFTVLWTVTTKTGKGFSLSTMEDSSLSKSLEKFGPGEIRECSSTGGGVAAEDDGLAKVEVVVDYVLFSDGTAVGRNKTNSASQIRSRQLGANALRSYLRVVYRRGGLDALLRELNDPSN